MICSICRSGMDISGWFERGTTILWRCASCGHVKDRPCTPLRYVAALLASRAGARQHRTAHYAPRVLCGRHRLVPISHGPAYLVADDAHAHRHPRSIRSAEANISAESPAAQLEPVRHRRIAVPRFTAAS